MTDQKDTKESQCPFYNPQAETTDKPSHLQASTTSGKACAKPETSHHAVRWVLSIFLLAVVLYLSFNYFSHRHPITNTTNTVNTTETIPDSGKNTTLVTPTTATNGSDTNQLESNNAATSAS